MSWKCFTSFRNVEHFSKTFSISREKIIILRYWPDCVSLESSAGYRKCIELSNNSYYFNRNGHGLIRLENYSPYLWNCWIPIYYFQVPTEQDSMYHNFYIFLSFNLLLPSSNWTSFDVSVVVALNVVVSDHHLPLATKNSKIKT